MKTPKPIILIILLFLELTLTAQVQWYQNQDGNNPPPYGTVATMIQPFTSSHFIACYLWSTNNEFNTWKISRSTHNGTEQRTFFLTGIASNVEFKIGQSNTVYVFERSFTPEYNPLYKIYKLDANLNPVASKSIEFPNGYFIYNVNAFEIDNQGNLYFAGDGQYPNTGGSFSPASFVLKTNKNLVKQWQRMDSTETSFSRLHVDRSGRVIIIQDYYGFFPAVKIKRYGHNGQIMNPFTVQTDVDRYSLYSALDDDDNILLYGGKTVGETSQSLFLKRVSRVSGQVAYSKTYFTAPSTQLNDFRVDRDGNIFTLVTQTFGPDDQKSRISKIKISNGSVAWSKTISFSSDSCNLTRLVMGQGERFYAVGERRSRNYFSKGFAVRVRKSGQLETNFPGPDSVAYQRLHWLADGIMDHNNQLIAIGNTSDFDSMTNSNNYFRSFAVKFGANNNNNCDWDRGMAPEASFTEEEEIIEEEPVNAKITIFPNPAQHQVTVSNLDPAEFNRMTVYTINGVQLQEQSINATSGKMNISHLPNGSYILVLSSTLGRKTKTLRFVVKK